MIPDREAVPGIAAGSAGDDARTGDLRRAVLLSAVSVAWSGAVGLLAAYVAFATNALSLLGFGVDAVIDAVASVTLIWRFRIESTQPGRAAAVEKVAERIVGVALLALGAYLIYGAIAALAAHARPEASSAALVILAASIVVLPGLARAKFVVARNLQSGALRLDSLLTAVAAVLALTSLLSLAAQAVGFAAADAIAALVVAAIIVREGAASLLASRSG